MENETVIPGVGVGGLKDKYEIKILICYLLNSINTPFSREQLSYVFQDGQLVNYFSFCDALAELIATNHITCNKIEFDEVYTLNEVGVETASKLSHSLPISLRDQVVSTSMQLLAKIKNEKENEVKIVPYKNGFLVQCVIHDIEFDLMQFEVFVPDILQAEKVKQKFQDNPLRIYQGLIQLLVDECN